ncbi:glutamine--fructose-6-phosphate transaminase (isomerizing) [Brucellaceae bacterium C25G]
MCGIIGIVAGRDVASLLVDSLKRLEYRGYDSAGIATLDHGTLARRRAEGKLVNLESHLKDKPLPGVIGIGHTRWATHGKPVERNAHPHMTQRLAVVHNGIIENFAELRASLQADGYVFETETDTEAVAHLVTREMDRGLPPIEAVKSALPQLKGAFALALIFEGVEGLLIGARQGPPLAIGYGDKEMYLGSDAIALAPLTDMICYLEDGDWVVVRKDGATIFDAENNEVKRPVQKVQSQEFLVSKGNHRHFMEKEIHEQPEVIGHTLAHYLDLANGTVRQDVAELDFSKIDRLSMSACGTAYYAAAIGKYWFEQIARIPVDIDIASEFRYREMPLSKNTLAMFVSQSGETADTLASLRYCKSQGLKIASIVNVTTSTIARESDAVFPILAGPEIGVASTKAFTSQLTVMASLAVMAAKQRGVIDDAQEAALVKQLSEVPRIANQVLKLEGEIEKICRELAQVKHVLYLGRGTSFPLAMEGALKLKEISYIHAEGYAAGELKHGPIALIDDSIPVIVIAPSDRLYEKTVSNMQEVAARGGRIILITDAEGVKHASVDTMATIILPEMAEFITPLLYALPVQMLAYYTAVFMGTDVDQPRNLAKSVTVE